MTDALINDKPQFVRLFCENGLNIVDYLTYRRLESLYSSMCDSSLAYVLLQKRLMERLNAAGSKPSVDQDLMVPLKNSHNAASGSTPAMKFSLFEVSQKMAKREALKMF